tara:strand:+ start:61 stop:870 length:810 start_codon:yes stop_codon:yes gene_type:complete
MSIVNAKEYVSNLDIRDGESRRVSCPECGGYNTFTVSRVDGRVLYNCYKNSCGTKGGVAQKRSVDALKARFKQVQWGVRGVVDTYLPEFTLPPTVTTNLETAACLEYIDDMNIQASIDEGYATIMYDFAQERCVFLIHDDNKNMLGAVGRSLCKDVLPKWKRYDRRKDLMFFCGARQGTAVLVEDCASACTVFASGYTGVALLGTSLNENHIYQLRVFDKVIVALDADASKKAIKMQKMLAPHVNSELLFLTDDLKYFTPECVKSLLTK